MEKDTGPNGGQVLRDVLIPSGYCCPGLCLIFENGSRTLRLRDEQNAPPEVVRRGVELYVRRWTVVDSPVKR